MTACPTLGDVSAGKLERIGIANVAALAGASPTAIVAECGNELPTARRWVTWAREALEKSGFMQKSTMTASEMLRRERAAPVLPTGTSKKLDAFFRGGLRGGAVYEVYGEQHNGKSQLCFQMAIQALQKDGGKVVYIESEGAFKPARVEQMCQARGIDADGVLDRIEVKSSINSAEQAHHIASVQSRVRGEDIRLIVVDSFTGHVRVEMAGRENMANRSKWIMHNVGILKSVARVNSIPVLLTNQVTTDMDTVFGDDKVAFGGTGLGHAVTYLVKIYVPANSKMRKFQMEDSPEDPEIEEVVYLDDGGYVDENPAKKRGAGGK